MVVVTGGGGVVAGGLVTGGDVAGGDVAGGAVAVGAPWLAVPPDDPTDPLDVAPPGPTASDPPELDDVVPEAAE